MSEMATGVYIGPHLEHKSRGGILWKSRKKGRMSMENQIGKVAYWLGIICTVIAIVTRGLAVIGIWALPGGGAGRISLSYKSFLDGAMLFFVMAIASSVAVWVKQQRS